VISDDRGTYLARCESGSLERVGDTAKIAQQLSWLPGVVLIRIEREKGSECIMRTVDSPAWTTLPACDARGRDDGSQIVETRLTNPRPGAKPRCLTLISKDGNKLPCGAQVGSRYTPPPDVATADIISLANARYFAPRRAAVPTKDLTGIVEVGDKPYFTDTRRISAPNFNQCVPIMPTAPLFRCKGEDRTTVIGRVDASGQWREEFRRKLETDGEDALHVTVDGGVALGGTCEGALEQAACVRRRDGSYHTVTFSPALVEALTRTAPVTKLVPTQDGELYVGVGSLKGGLMGEVRILVFKADAGPGVTVENIPTWMLASLAGLGELFLFGGGGAALGYTEGLSLGFSSAENIRLWPFERRHPAFGTPEQCRIDLTLRGAFEVGCEQGKLSAVGRLGLLQKRADEIFETLDAGSTWTRVRVPSGLDGQAIQCTALGCRIGPYYRRGWGPASAG
jgi:hypothetical protein